MDFPKRVHYLNRWNFHSSLSITADQLGITSVSLEAYFLSESSSAAYGTEQPRPFPPTSLEELQHPLNPSFPTTQVLGSNILAPANH